MKKFVTKKKIVIDTKGPLSLKGGISGPIEIPYYENITIIGKMIMRGYKVFEILNDGSKVRLTLTNYNVELNPSSPSIKKTLEPVRSSKDIISTKQKSNSAKVVVGAGSKTTDSFEII